jgi:hypothetical protein
LTNDRPWLGEIDRALVRTGGNAVDYPAPDGRDALEIAPARFWYAGHPVAAVPFEHVSLQGAFIHVVGLHPPRSAVRRVGRAWCGARRSWQRSAALVLAVAVVSAALETLQFAFAGPPPIDHRPAAQHARRRHWRAAGRWGRGRQGSLSGARPPRLGNASTRYRSSENDGATTFLIEC